MTVSDGGLRARRRRETARDIHEAVLRLATTHGLDQVTVDMISAEAGVSRRTFFNYFPSREAAVVAGPRELPEDGVAEFLAAPATEPAAVLRDLSDLLLRELRENQPARSDLRQVMVLAQEHPGVLAALLANFDAFEQVVAGLVARRLHQEPNEDVPALLASIALSAMRTGLQRWSNDAEGADDSPVGQVGRTVALLHSLLVP